MVWQVMYHDASVSIWEAGMVLLIGPFTLHRGWWVRCHALVAVFPVYIEGAQFTLEVWHDRVVSALAEWLAVFPTLMAQAHELIYMHGEVDAGFIQDGGTHFAPAVITIGG
jgi:hypothetical protein